MLDFSSITQSVRDIAAIIITLCFIVAGIIRMRAGGNIYAKQESNQQIKILLIAAAVLFLLPLIVKMLMRGGNFCVA